MSRKAKPSTSMHVSRAKARTSHRAKSTSWSRKSSNFSRNAILSVIILAMLVVILCVLMQVFVDKESTVKHKIEEISADYYENYYYDSINKDTSTDSEENLPSNILEKYHERGLVIVPLRQLLLFDNRRHLDSAALLTEYCDENTTYIRIYPDPPYGKKDYHVEYNYSCTF